MRICRNLFFDFLHSANRRCQRTSVVVAVERIQQRAVLRDEGQFRRRGAGIDTEIAVPVIGEKISLFYLVAVVAFAELVDIPLHYEKGAPYA